jgi:hypothetical protein
MANKHLGGFMKKSTAVFILTVVSLCTLGLVINAIAADTYGKAGCGLGSMAFGDNPKWWAQTFAATTNGTFANQTFAITSGTSNCDQAKPGKKSAKAFIETNREALAKDISKGNGETIRNLAKIGECSDSNLVGEKLQMNFSRIFPNTTVSDDSVSDSIIGLLSSDAGLYCKAL